MAESSRTQQASTRRGSPDAYLKLDPSYIARTIRLASLAPDIIEAILEGREPEGSSLRALRRDLPLGWEEQRRVLTK